MLSKTKHFSSLLKDKGFIESTGIKMKCVSNPQKNRKHKAFEMVTIMELYF